MVDARPKRFGMRIFKNRINVQSECHDLHSIYMVVHHFLIKILRPENGIFRTISGYVAKN